MLKELIMDIEMVLKILRYKDKIRISKQSTIHGSIYFRSLDNIIEIGNNCLIGANSITDHIPHNNCGR